MLRQGSTWSPTTNTEVEPNRFTAKNQIKKNPMRGSSYSAGISPSFSREQKQGINFSTVQTTGVTSGESVGVLTDRNAGK